ncbi:Uncharacterised protein [Aeromonas hydrophila]|nr:Uncharacterised protein [Aeromonas hydrophila]
MNNVHIHSGLLSSLLENKMGYHTMGALSTLPIGNNISVAFAMQK